MDIDFGGDDLTRLSLLGKFFGRDGKDWSRSPDRKTYSNF